MSPPAPILVGRRQATPLGRGPIPSIGPARRIDVRTQPHHGHLQGSLKAHGAATAEPRTAVACLASGEGMVAVCRIACPQDWSAS